MIVQGFEPFVGQHCETTATGCLLKHAGLDLSEPMLFGLGQGLGFIYWDTKSADFPFLGGRIKQNLITDNLAANLGLQIERKQTTSTTRAWQNVQSSIDAGVPVGLQLDSYYLDYFTRKVHFGGHIVAMYGYDDSAAYLVDTAPQGTRVTACLQNLALARNARGPMTSRNLSYSIAVPDGAADLREAAIKAIRANAEDFLTPPIKNMGYKGIATAARQVNQWLRRTGRPEEDLTLAATLMERAGTGGALFRNLYRDFLGECAALMGGDDVDEAHQRYARIAPLWTQVSALIAEAGKTREQAHLDHASNLLTDICKQEKAAMQVLARIDARTGARIGPSTRTAPAGTLLSKEAGAQ
jgi:hypothetical protein